MSVEDPNILIVQRCATAVLVPPGAVIIRCGRCDEKCWLSKGGQADMAEHDLETVCVECTYAGIVDGSIAPDPTDNGEMGISSHVREELLSLGMSETDIRSTLDKAGELAILAAFEGMRRKWAVHYGRDGDMWVRQPSGLYRYTRNEHGDVIEGDHLRPLEWIIKHHGTKDARE